MKHHSSLLTVRETAERLNLREGTIRAWLAAGRLPKVKLGRATRVPADAVEALIVDGLQASGSRRPR
jgi:DNA binding domain, excisionase family